MALADFKHDMQMCCGCSTCKFIPLEQIRGYQHANVCPSIARYNFHAYSGGGRMILGIDMLSKDFEYTSKLLDIIYNCQMCGACDISCKYAMDMEVLESINEMRINCVETGHTLSIANKLIRNMNKQGTMVPGVKIKRGQWAEGVDVKDAVKQKANVFYHVGCRTCYDKDMWKVARDTVALLQKAGVDVGVAGADELCCGSRAYQMGYKADFLQQAGKYMELIKQSGAKVLVTGCADCYYAFKVLYDKFNLKGDLEVLHTTEFLERLINEGKLKPAREVDLKVTYHDPCHLGRLGEFYQHWDGRRVPGHISIFEPPKELRRGSYGIYRPPRNILESIPGLKLVEMDRTKEYAWCCGAGGGVKETNADFAAWTAKERITEAESTGAGAIVTACPGCEQSFNSATESTGSSLKVYDIVELLAKAVLKGDGK